MVPPLVGESQVIRNIKKLISRFARTGENILIIGETGVGKDLVAQSLYNQSGRVGKPFVKLNCAGLTKSINEIDISHFDQKETNEAFKKRSGLFEKINGGILYLDNVDLMSSAHQSEILPFLQDDHNLIRDLKAPFPMDICLISSTKSNLEQMVKEGKFSEYLYFRLSTLQIDIAPLRDRPEDIPFLIDYYYKRYVSAYKGFEIRAFPKRKVIDELCDYRWPGNVRELQNIIKRIIFTQDITKNISDLIGISGVDIKSVNDEMTKKMIRHSNNRLEYFNNHAPDLASLPLKKATKKIVAMAEKELISNVLEKTGWNRSRANKMLGISYKTLLYKMQQLNINQPEL
jgi:two-component system response regulator AtoC